MLNYILIATQIIVLLIIGTLVWQILCKFKSIPEDEIVGEERAKYMTQRLQAIVVCSAIEMMLLVAATVLRILESI